MDFGTIDYTCQGNNGNGDPKAAALKLTLIGQNDDDILLRDGISALRQRRIIRLALEAKEQGCLLSFEDLQALLSTSLSTIKRDVAYLNNKGIVIPLKNRKKNTGEQKSDTDYSLLLLSEGI